MWRRGKRERWALSVRVCLERVVEGPARRPPESAAPSPPPLPWPSSLKMSSRFSSDSVLPERGVNVSGCVSEEGYGRAGGRASREKKRPAVTARRRSRFGWRGEMGTAAAAWHSHLHPSGAARDPQHPPHQLTPTPVLAALALVLRHGAKKRRELSCFLFACGCGDAHSVFTLRSAGASVEGR